MQVSRGVLAFLALISVFLGVICAKAHTNGDIREEDMEAQFDSAPGVALSPPDFDSVVNDAKANIKLISPQADEKILENADDGDGEEFEENGRIQDDVFHAQFDGMPGIASDEELGKDVYINDAKGGILPRSPKEIEIKAPSVDSESKKILTNGEVGREEFATQFDDMPGLLSEKGSKEDLQIGLDHSSTPEPQRIIEIQEKTEPKEDHSEKLAKAPLRDLPEEFAMLEKFGNIVPLQSADVGRDIEIEETPEPKAVVPEPKAVVPESEAVVPEPEGHNGEIEDGDYKGQFDDMPGVGSGRPIEVLPSGGIIKATEAKHAEEESEGPDYNGDLGEPHFFGKLADLKSDGLDIPELRAVRPKTSIADNGLVDSTEFSHGALPDAEIGTAHDHAESPEPRAKVEVSKNDGHNGDILGETFPKFVQNKDLDTEADQSDNPELKVVRIITQKDNGLDGDDAFDGHDGELARVHGGGVSVDSIIENAKAEAKSFVSEKGHEENVQLSKPDPINPEESKPHQDDFQAQFDGMPGIHVGGLDIDAAVHDAAAQAKTFPRVTEVNDIPRVAIVHQMVAEAPMITDQTPIDILGDNDANNKPRLSGVTTFTHTSSGVISTSIATVTFDPTHTKILSCIFGCSTLVVTTPVGKAGVAAMADPTTITILPVTLPCSLLICPPCGCTSKIISVTGCPVITTSTPGSSFVTVTADFTVTFITTTVTVTDCTATTCLFPSTFTITDSGTTSTFTLTQTTTSTVSIKTITSFSTTKKTTFVEPDEGCPCGYDFTSTSEKKKQRCGCEPTTSIVPPDCPCQQQQEESEGCGCGDGDDDDDGEYFEIGYFNFKVAQGAAGQPKKAKKAKKGSVKRPVALPAVTRTITDEVCSTFIVCNPRQFSCPAQITDGTILPTFMAEWGLLPNQIPNGGTSLEISQPTGSYIGFDGKAHGLGSGMVSNSSSPHYHMGGVKGVKIVKDANVVFGGMTTAVAGDELKDGQMKAAKKNGAPTSSPWMGLPILVMMMAWMFL